MQITHYLHTALQVSDLKRAEYFYGTILGLTRIDRVLRSPGAWYQIGEVQIHLIANADFVPQSPPEKWGRDRHLAFAVADLGEAKAQLLEQGCILQMSASGRSALFVQDPDGNVIELSQAN